MSQTPAAFSPHRVSLWQLGATNTPTARSGAENEFGLDYLEALHQRNLIVLEKRNASRGDEDFSKENFGNCGSRSPNDSPGRH
jgi:hypothetical protein